MSGEARIVKCVAGHTMTELPVVSSSIHSLSMVMCAGSATPKLYQANVVTSDEPERFRKIPSNALRKLAMAYLELILCDGDQL